MFEKSPLDPLVCPDVVNDITQSTVSKNRNGDRRHPCLTPVKMLLARCYRLLDRWMHGSYADRISVRMSSGIPWCCKSFQRVCLSTLSKAFSKSKKHVYRDELHSIDCSMIMLRVAMWFMQDLSILKPACSSGRRASTKVFILSNGNLLKTLLGTDRRAIPLQFLQSFRSPFLGNCVI